jgi:ABC-type dipeptide/oligopeptide/nickel transport system permease subunit
VVTGRLETVAPPVRARWWPRKVLSGRVGIVVGGVLLLIPVICAVGAGVLAPHDPLEQDLSVAQQPPVWMDGGSWSYPLGTDFVGRDILSRIIYGARVSLIVGLGGTLLALVIGVPLGLLAGFYGRWLETAIMGVAEVVLSLPYIVLVVFLVGILGPSLLNIILIFGIIDSPLFARVTRGEVLRLRDSEFIEAARALGAGDRFILWKHIGRNIVGVLVTVATFEVAQMILLEAGLGFLGLGVPPTVPSWGNMVAEGRDYLASSWWLATFAGLAILVTTLGINLVGDWIRQVTDPRAPQIIRG